MLCCCDVVREGVNEGGRDGRSRASGQQNKNPTVVMLGITQVRLFGNSATQYTAIPNSARRTARSAIKSEMSFWDGKKVNEKHWLICTRNVNVCGVECEML